MVHISMGKNNFILLFFLVSTPKFFDDVNFRSSILRYRKNQMTIHAFKRPVLRSIRNRKHHTHLVRNTMTFTPSETYSFWRVFIEIQRQSPEHSRVDELPIERAVLLRRKQISSSRHELPHKFYIHAQRITWVILSLFPPPAKSKWNINVFPFSFICYKIS